MIWFLLQSTLHWSTNQIMILLLPRLAQKTDHDPAAPHTGTENRCFPFSAQPSSQQLLSH